MATCCLTSAWSWRGPGALRPPRRTISYSNAAASAWAPQLKRRSLGISNRIRGPLISHRDSAVQSLIDSDPHQRAASWTVTRYIRCVLILVATSCTTWHGGTIPEPSTRSDTTARPATIRVLDWRGSALTLFSAIITRDSIIGQSIPHTPSTRTAIPLSAVARWERRSDSAPRTIGLLAGITVGFLILVGLPAAIFSSP